MLIRERCDEIAFENALLNCAGNDIGARYIAACNLHELVARHPQGVRPETIASLEAAVLDPTIVRQRQSLTLCRELARALTTIFTNPEHQGAALRALGVLKRTIREATGSSHRALTEAAGMLPLAIKPPPLDPVGADEIATASWARLIGTIGSGLAAEPLWLGRSLVAPLVDDPRLLVVKLGRPADNSASLGLEPAWQARLAASSLAAPGLFEVPTPVSLDNSPVFRLTDLPVSLPVDQVLHPERIGIAFLAPAHYFAYPNEFQDRALPDPEAFIEVMGRNSRLLGGLAGQGIIHTAPIPLFHNRTQQERRTDEGLYDWPLAGRLDRWLCSCRHPNFGFSGLRDFEHFVAMAPGGARFYWHIGAHFLSLLLVCGSYFRNREPGRVGLAGSGRPVDARHLFDRDLLARLINVIFSNYYRGFVGRELAGPPPLAVEHLAGRMIDEMGVDHHVEEMLRVIDQEQMSDELFKEILVAGGYQPRQAAAMPRGARDVPVLTGPHLGGFNQRISLPEIIDGVAAMAASCVLDRYLHDERPGLAN